MTKKFISMLLAIVLTFSMAAVGVVSASAAVDKNNKIYFDVKSTGWSSVKTVYCHIWKADYSATSTGSDWPEWQSKAERCVYDTSTGIATYDLSNLWHDFSRSDGKIYCVMFSANNGVQTYTTIMNGKCIGDTLYCTGNMIEIPVDPERTIFEARWRKNKDCGPEKAITITGKIIGDTHSEFETDATMMAKRLIYYYDDPEITKHTGDIMRQLYLSDKVVMDTVNDILTATHHKDAKKISNAVAEILASTDEKLPNPSISKFQSTADGLKIGIKKVDGVAKYRVYYKDSKGKWIKLTDTTGLSVTDKNVTANASKTYTVKGLDSNGHSLTGYNSKGWSAKFVAPNPSITKLQSTASGMKIDISKIAGVAKYRVYYKDSKGKWIKLADTTGLSVIDKNVTANATKTYTVKGIDSKGNAVTGYNSKGWNAKFVAPNPSLSLKNTKNGVNISWSKIAGVAKYRVYYKNSKGKWTKLADTTKLSYLDTSIKNKAKRTYTIRGLDKNGKTVTGYNTKGWTITCKR